jgi:hypothetical protein
MLATPLLLMGCAATPVPHYSPWVAVVPPPPAGQCVDTKGVEWGQRANSADVYAGNVILLALGVGEEDVSSTFPWLEFESSDADHLVPVSLCESWPVNSLPVRYGGFIATRGGSYMLNAALAADWRPPTSHADPLGPVSVEVLVDDPGDVH